LKICTGYENRGGERLSSFPSHSDELNAVIPVYEEVEGWQEEIRGRRSETRLPAAAGRYIRKIEELLNVRIALVSTGPDRNDIIVREQLW
jgi:adenylosuccinate synthase